MTTAADVVTRAYRLFGLVRVGSTPTPAQSEEGLSALNAMVNNWAANDGVDLGIYDAESATEIDGDLEEPLKFNLAVRLMMEYPRLQKPFLILEANRMKATLEVQEMDEDMRYDAFKKTRFNINADR